MADREVEVKGIGVRYKRIDEEDYISLTDIAKAKNPDHSGLVISHWLRNNSTIQYLGLWETLNNENFNVTEFGNIRNKSGENSFAIKENIVPTLTEEQLKYVYADEADLLNVALFGKTALQWRKENPTLKGNIRDYATIEQLLVIANMESLNAYLIEQNIMQDERLKQLNSMARSQLRVLQESNSKLLTENRK